jgi:DNA ligase (NAD+)
MNYNELKNAVLYHNELYYDKAKTEISDAEYDKLYDSLVEAEKKQGFKDWDSPTNRVGHSAGKVKHPHRLYSLEKTYDANTIKTIFDVKTRKLDGACVALIFRNSKSLGQRTFVKAITRGNGEYGEDVTHLFLPKYKDSCLDAYLLSDSDTISVVGECVTFLKPDNYRNYVAGAMGLDSVAEFKFREIVFIAHDVLGVYNNYIDRLQLLNKQFSTVLDEELVKNIPSDGTVFRINDFATCQKLGYTSKYPKFAIALKTREIETAQTILTDIIWAIGRTGTVNPTGIVNPVVLGGATVSRLTLHNIAFIEDNDICLGDKIEIERAGEIIPKYLRTIEESPIRVKITDKEAEESIGAKVKRVGPKLFVTDNSVNIEKVILNYVSHMDIQGLGPASISKLNLTSISDLYKDRDWTILGVNGDKIAQEIEYSKSKSYEKVLAGLGIPSVGLSLAKKIIAKIPKFQDLYTIEYEKIDKIGPKITDKILIWFDENSEWVQKLPVQLEATLNTNIGVEKKVICITGKLDMTRNELTSILEEKGYEVRNTVTKSTYALITDGRESSSKTTQAAKYGTKIVNYFDNKTDVLEGII